MGHLSGAGDIGDPSITCTLPAGFHTHTVPPLDQPCGGRLPRVVVGAVEPVISQSFLQGLEGGRADKIYA